MFAAIVQGARPVLTNVGRFVGPAIKAGATAGIKDAAAVVVAYGAPVIAGFAGYGIYKGCRTLGRATATGVRSIYDWATDRVRPAPEFAPSQPTKAEFDTISYRNETAPDR
jgi:hypothetical protein